MSWTSLVGTALSTMLARRTRLMGDAAHWRRHTAGLQRRQLRLLLQQAAQTEFGRSHDFARLTRLNDADLLAGYRSAVACGEYDGFRPFINRMRDGGEIDVLWPGRIRHFAQTSGTTAGDKYIPVSREMLRSNYRCALDIFANAQRFGCSLHRLLTGKVLFLGGSTAMEVNKHGIATGDLSGIVTPLIRWPISEIYLPGKRIALMSDWPAKIEAMARACVHADVRMINGMPSWMLVLFERVLELARADGRPAKTIADIWPNLELIVHGGVKYAPFDSRVRTFWSGRSDGPDVARRLELYPASEGFIAIQDQPGSPGLRLCSDAMNFYEFIPLERVNDAAPPAFAADEVEPGQRYVVCMSTCAGLWRYIIGDVVEFDAVPDRLGRPDTGSGPARLRIVGRHRHFINAFGENLIVEHIENAVAAAAGATGLLLGEFTAGPVYPQEATDLAPSRRAGLEVVLEHTGDISPDRLARFNAVFDSELKRQNVDYTTKRTAGLGMAPPTVTVLPLGSFHRWMQQRGKLGGQHKCPRCANHRDFVDGVKAAAGVG